MTIPGAITVYVVLGLGVLNALALVGFATKFEKEIARLKHRLDVLELLVSSKEDKK